MRNAFRCAILERMPVTTADKVVALSRDFGSQRRLAEVLGVSPAQVTRWRRGQGVDEANAGRVDLLELVMANLLRLYPTEAAERWLLGVNPSLRGRRPLDLVRRGQTREVLDAIASERAGNFA
ncbi:MAG TPA: hypothetical protein VFJ14_01270 [Nocardioidaceae bacterium]|nr:hypothetical protein [Nocardioidaceae bacterium]